MIKMNLKKALEDIEKHEIIIEDDKIIIDNKRYNI